MQKTIKKAPQDEGLSASSSTEIIAQNAQPVNFNAETLIAKAIDQQVPVETMEKLLAMRRELKAEWAKEQFDKALAALQSEMPIIKKNANAGSGNFTYNYASLDYIVSQTGALISKHGFSYTFDSKKTESSLITFINVNHVAGHKERSEFEITIDTGSRMNISQKDGAASSYGKRYAFCNAFGILTGEDDNDVQLPSEPPKRTYTPTPVSTASASPAPDLPSAAQLKMIEDLMDRKNISGEQINDLGYTSATLTKGKASILIDILKTKPDAPKDFLQEMDRERELQDIGDSIQ